MPRSLTLPVAACAALALLVAAPAAVAQDAGAGRRRGSGSAAADAAKAKAKAAEEEAAGLTPLAPGEIRVRAESYEQVAKGHLEARGTVDVRMAGVRVFADKADVFEETRPDGSVGRRVVAEGDVVFLRGPERLSGDRAEIDESGRGVFLNAVGYVEPGVFIEARRIERVDEDTYRVFGGHFSSCSQPSPRWSFSATRAKVDVDDKIQATNAVFKVKGVPAFYAPYIYYPIRRDGRATGLLLPRLGYSSFKGFEFGTGFFWAMGRSADQTFYFDSYSRFGYGFGHELRWALASPSRGLLRTYVIDPRTVAAATPAPAEPPAEPDTTPAATATGRGLEYNLDWTILQTLPGKVRGSLSVNQFSDLLFNRQHQETFDGTSQRSERWSVALERELGFAVVSAHAENANTYFANAGSTYQVNTLGRAPGLALRRFPRQVLGGIVFGLIASADHYRYGVRDPNDPAAPPADEWSRYDFAPTLSRPLNVSFLNINPSIGYRYTHYDASIDPEGRGLIGPPIDRRFFEASLGVVGPTFSRVFDTPGFGYSERFKHTIGPEINWRYITRVDRYNEIPKSPYGDDYQFGTNQINYALVQRFFAKRRGPSGKFQPYELLSWRLMQTYYVQIRDSSGAPTGVQNRDPNYSSSTFGPAGRPEHLSQLSSRVRLRPAPDASLEYNLEYDVNFRQLRRSSVSVNVNRPGLQLNGSWNRARRMSEDPSQRFVGQETLRGSTSFPLWPGHLRLEGSADYDLKQQLLYQMRAQLRYSVQCCGLTVEHTRYNWGGFVNAQWRFSLELANVGSVGTSSGGDAAGRRF